MHGGVCRGPRLHELRQEAGCRNFSPCPQPHRRRDVHAPHCERRWILPGPYGSGHMDTNTLLIIVLVVLFLGGGGFYYNRRRI